MIERNSHLLDEHEQLAVAHGLRAGQREAWARLYDAYSLEIWRYVSKLVGPPAADVFDVVQETFIEAARSARQFDAGRGTLWSWLTGIAHHQAALVWRRAARAARLRQLADAARETQVADAGDALDAPLEQRELSDLVRRVLSELPADYAAILVAKYLDEQSLDDLSQKLAVSVDAVKSKLARARREFRDKFDRLTRIQQPLVRD